MEPVSFDVEEAGSVLDKANRWAGRTTSLMDSSEQSKIHLLLGVPQDKQPKGAFVKAENILNKMPGKKAFAEHLAKEVFGHGEEKRR